MARPPHREGHRIANSGWLRAAVLGANDGILSTASLMAGVAAAAAAPNQLLLTGFAGLTAGALSMAAGEYVSVSSQADAEKHDLAREAAELAADHDSEHRELAGIYVGRGLTPELAREVATQLMDHDALGAHARDELGLTDHGMARPVEAALSSAASFAAGASIPVLTAWLAPHSSAVPAIIAVALVALGLLGWVGARAGGATPGPAMVRVLFWGALAMAVTAGIGRLVGAAL
jgi:VIT1/CCC1 family predicted Fe2+/Mn2+ transporter